jgi:hypothetical protein
VIAEQGVEQVVGIEIQIAAEFFTDAARRPAASCAAQGACSRRGVVR